MDLYLLNDNYRESIDEAIDLAFSSNPVLFVGLGMSEEDVLRPLRQFVSDQERRWDRTAIALMPATKPVAQRHTEASTLYTRYGTLAIYYGDAEVDGHHCEWLMIIVELCHALLSYNESIWHALRMVRRQYDRGGNPQQFAHEAQADQAQGKQQLIEALQFLSRHLCVQEPADDSGDVGSQHNRNDWLLEHCPRLVSAVNSSKYKSDVYAKRLDRFIAEFDFDSFAPSIERQSLGSDNKARPNITFELGLLGNLRSLLLSLNFANIEAILSGSQAATGDVAEFLRRIDISVDRLIRDCCCIRIGVQGCLGSIHTAILSGFLRSLEEQQKNWLSKWQDEPKVRQPQLEIKPYTHPDCAQCGAAIGLVMRRCDACGVEPPQPPRLAILPVRYIRHHIENTFTNFQDNWPAGRPLRRNGDEKSRSDSFYTGVRAFDTFVDAMELALDGDTPESGLRGKRRTFLIAAHRGLGKGVFLSALASGVGIEAFIHCSWNRAGAPALENPVRYRAAIFINYSFSTEIASTWDMLIDTLVGTCAEFEVASDTLFDRQTAIPRVYEVHGGSGGASAIDAPACFTAYRDCVAAIVSELEQLTRVQKIRFLLERWQVLQSAMPQRLLICMNALDLLYKEGGEPKNAEIAAIVELLMSADFKACPYDLMLVCEEENIPGLVRPLESDPSSYLGEFIDNDNDGELSYKYNSAHHNRVHQLITRPNISNFGLRQVEQRLRNSQLHARYVGSDGKSMQCPLPSSLDTSGRYLHFCRVMQPEIFLIDNFDVLAAILYLGYLIESPARIPAAKVQRLVNGYGEILQKCERNRHLGSRRDFLTQARKFLLASVVEYGYELLSHEDQGFVEKSENRAHAILRLRYDPPDALHSDWLQHERYDDKSYRDWREVRKRLRHNRFSFTILLAATEQHAIMQPNLAAAKRAAEGFINAVVANVGTVSVERREEIIVHDVLDLHEKSHRAGDPVRDIDLHSSILRHLAVMGQPCSPDVLVRVPEIRQYFDRNAANRRLSRRENREIYPQRRTGELIQALDQLERSGLVFKLTAQPSLARLDEHLHSSAGSQENFYRGTPTRDLHRYALHRLIHRHVVRKLGGSLKEFVSTNNFAATLFASMPSDLPKPTHGTYQFLRRLVGSLSGYPDRYMLGTPAEPTEPWHFNTARPHTRVQALRAALGILRSTFSIAVVSRFDEYRDEVQDSSIVKGMNHAGYFEEHRIQVRWLIRHATYLDGNLHNQPDGIADADADLAPADSSLNAFYRDESIWLYNECGVICLVQGNLLDAVGLFRHALLCNRDIEGFGEDGAQHCRISLNLAVAQIERGRLYAASNRLDTVLSHRTPGTDLHAIAVGYKALVHHLSGDRLLALQGYCEALQVLRKLRDSRAASIVCRHCADLHRLMGDHQSARDYIDESIAFAESGGHADLNKRSQLARVKLEQKIEPHQGIGERLRHLRRIEKYAEIMDIPALSCEASHIHAEILLAQGETSLAGKLLQKGIAKARRNGLQLRMTSALTQYGRVMLHRGQTETGRKILITALEMTKKFGVQVEIDRIERQLAEI